MMVNVSICQVTCPDTKYGLSDVVTFDHNVSLNCADPRELESLGFTHCLW